MKNPQEQDRSVWIAHELKKLRQEINEMKFNQPITIEESAYGASSPISVANNDYLTITGTATPTNAQTLLPDIIVTPYKNSISTDNAYPSGANWSDAERISCYFFTWADWGSSDGKNVKQVQHFINKSGSAISMLTVVAARYIKNTA